jgi:ankyrin repeat protein
VLGAAFGLFAAARSPVPFRRPAPESLECRRALDEAVIEAARADEVDGVRALLALGIGPDPDSRSRQWRELSEAMAMYIQDYDETYPGAARRPARWCRCRYPHGYTALMAGASTGALASVRLLLAAGANVNARDERGTTAVIEAAASGCYATAGVLLHRGADFRLADRGGETALDRAAAAGKTRLVRLLLDRGAPVNGQDPVPGRGRSDPPLFRAAYHRHAECVRLLLDRGADPNRRGSRGETALMAAAGNGNVEYHLMTRSRQLAMARLLRRAGGR